jgi:hypothetical protein
MNLNGMSCRWRSATVQNRLAQFCAPGRCQVPPEAVAGDGKGSAAVQEPLGRVRESVSAPAAEEVERRRPLSGGVVLDPSPPTFQ